MRAFVVSAFVSLLAITACATPASAPAGSPAAVASAAAPTVAPAAATPAATPKPPADKVTLLTDFTFFGYATPFFAGAAQGFFKDENIDITIQPGAGSADTATKVGAGAAQFGLADSISTLIAIGKNTPITIVASHWQKYLGGFCYVAGRKEIKAFKDFEGLRVGGSAEDSYLRVANEVMKELKLDPTKIQFTAMTSAVAAAGLNSGQLDAISCGLSTFPGRAITAKAQKIELRNFAFADNGFDALGHQIIVNNTVKANTGLVQRFINAYAKSVIWSQLNQDKAVDAYMKENPQQDRTSEKANFTDTIRLAVDAAAAGTNGQFYVPPTKLKASVDRVNLWYSVNVDATKAATNDFTLKIPATLRQGKLP